ncbi:ABC transporter permease [Cohnella sp. AR92]|uniref:ABC transporter permease n=1 Tax=Cohnella sp. AR92 TaxID=648716 RepID=UPI000F8DD67A|nr:ABC transporter permease [Cohnella sp. AR92]RUS47323.1 ABC transporter permease [Cohnella sp. AR92]
MTKWLVLFRKEWLEMVRSHRTLWLPASFILLGASQPVTTFFMPDILANASNLPEGAVLQFPTPEPFEVLASALSQFGVIGLLLVALSSMGILSGERSAGTAAMILVKPVSYASFVTAKWAAAVLLAIVSFAVGYGAAWYYTGALFEPVGWREVGASALLYALWLTLVSTLTLLFSSLLRSAAAAAFSSLAVAVLLSVAAGSLPFEQSWNPGRLSTLAASSLNAAARPLGGGIGSVWLTAAVTAAVIAAALLVAIRSMKRRPSEA